MQKASENLLSSYVDALHSIIYIRHFDSNVVDNALRNIAPDSYITEFNNALGEIDFNTKSPVHECTLCEFLKTHREDGYDQNTFFVLKDIHNELDNPEIIALLKRIAEDNLYRESYHASVFIVSPKVIIPFELENYITVFDVGLPAYDEIEGIIKEFASDLGIQIEQDVINDIALSFKGLNEFQIRQILNLAYQNGGTINSEKKQLIINEKKQFITKSGMLELVNFRESLDDIGGLENLKEWLIRKSKIFADLDKAIRFGVDVPKGIMIVGMPGCGKSLTAKATAGLFNIPLVRLDVGRLLGKYVGESEDNMRRALSVAEAISPCVLWIDEIEKAFSGVGSSGSDVTTRLFGQFLTWLQEKDNSVFIVATANDISGLPPEFLRKGRFDEIFFVDLPNPEERRKIFEIHLMKRRKWNRNIDSIALIKSTEGFNGADIESAVKNAIELAFIEKREFLTTDDLLDIINDTKSISVTLKDKIAKIKAMIEKVDIRLASREHTESRSESESAGKESAHGFNVTKRRHSGKIQEACKSKGAAFKVTRLGNSDSFRVDIPKGTNLSEWTVITKSTCRISTVGNCSNILSVNEPGWGERMLLGSAQKGHTRFNGLQVILERYSGIAPRDLYFIYQYV
ncbi:MAG: AAA family ATPase [Synergistaceae bacterium]|nr:AAA family ATPase [Synergistaceae bacterium]